MNPTPLRILLVEDNPADARLLQVLLAEQASVPSRWTHVPRLSEAIEAVANDPLDVVLLDLSLPDGQGIETLTQLQAHASHLPIIVITGTDSETVALEAMHTGAQDYLVKGQIDGELLARTLRYSIERKHVEEQLRMQAQLLANVNDAIIVCDLQLKISHWNSAAEELYGWRAEEVLDRPVNEILQTQFAAEDREQVLQQFEAQGVWKGEVDQRRKDGSRLTVLSSVTYVKDEKSRPIAIVAINHDITERKRAHDKSDLQNQRLSILREIDVAILRADTVEDIVGAALSHIRELMDCRRASLTLIDWETDEVLIFAISAVDETPLPPGNRLPLAHFKAVIPTLSQNQPMVFSDLRVLADPTPAIQLLLKDGLRSTCSLPLFSQGSLIGMFSMHSETPGFFDDEKVALGHEVANQVAIAITQRRLAQGLHESEQKFTTLFKRAPFATQLARFPGGEMVEVNEEFEKLVGYSREELIGKTSLELNMYPDPEIRARMVAEFQARGFVRNAELEFRTRFGDLRHLLISTDFVDIGGEKHVLTTAQDITERKQAEEKLRESQELFQMLFNSSPVAYGLARMSDGQIIDVNQAFEHLLGYSKAELVEKWGTDIDPWVDPNERRKAAEKFVKDGRLYGFEFAYKTKTGSIGWGITYAELFEQGEEKYVLSEFVDITERKQAEEKLRYQAHLLENVNDAIIASDAQFRLKAWNLAAEAIYGWKAEEVLGRDGVEILQTRFSEADAEEMRRQIAEAGYYIGEATQLRKDGTRIPVEVASIVLRDGDGKITDYVSVNRDITERKRAEATLRLENERFQRFVESNIVGIVIANAAGQIMTANDYYLRILGVARQDFEAGKVDWRKFTPPEWLPADEKAIQELREHGVCEPYEKEYERADGRRVPVYIADAMLPGPDEQIAAFVLDISELKRAEQRLRESEQKYSILFDKSAVPTALLQLPEVVIVDVNEALEKLTGFTEQELIGKTALELGLGGREERARMIAEFQEQGALTDNETPMFTKSGDQRIIVANTNPVLLNGQPYALTTIQDITERRRAEKALQDSQAQMSGIFNSAMDAIISIDADQRIVIFNPAAEKMFRWSRAEAIGQPLESLIPVRFRANHVSFIQNFAQTGVTNRTMGMNLGTIYGLRSDGQEFPIEASISKTDLSGKDLLTVILRDITERKRAEEALSQSEKRFRALTENISDVIAMIDREGLITYVSPGITPVLGYAADEIVGQNEFGLIHPDDLEMAKQNLKAVLDGDGSSASFVVRERHKDGSWRWVEGVGTNLLEEPGVEGIVVNFRDITERVESQEKIKRQFQRLNALRTIDMAIGTSFDMNLSLTVLLNQAMMQLGVGAAAILLHNPNTLTLDYAVGKGFTSSAIEQTHLRIGEGLAGRAALERRKTLVADLAQHDDRVARRELLKEEGFVSYYAAPLIAKGELKGVLEVFNRAEFHPSQEWLDFVETLAGQAAIAIDNSTLFINLQRANAELEQRVAQRTEELNQLNLELTHANRAKDAFLANMSHELRTPLNSILGLSEALLEQHRGPLNDYQQKYLQTIETSGRHLLDLITDILDLSKIEAGLFDYYPQNVGVDDICKSSLAFVKNQSLKRHIDLSYDNQSSIAIISADPRRLKQICVNLLTNAVKFTPDHGRVTLEVRNDPEKDLIQFSVVDTGIGILPEDLQRLFTPFVQVDSDLDRRYEGTGLGLALVQKLTDLHGGSVQVESEVGKGSRFTISLYCKHEISEQTEGIRLQEAPELGPGMERTGFQADAPATHRKILLAEDNAANILAIGEYLVSYGYEIVIAHNGLEAIEKAMEVDPDIILMDIQMPALDGLETTRRLRADPRFTSTPIIALTALTMPGDRERCLEAGVNDYISKPASLKALRERITSLLD